VRRSLAFTRTCMSTTGHNAERSRSLEGHYAKWADAKPLRSTTRRREPRLECNLAQLQRRRRAARARKKASKLFVRHATTKIPSMMSLSTRALETSSQKRARASSTLRRTTTIRLRIRTKCIMESGSWESENHSLFGGRETQGANEYEYKEKDITRPPVRAAETKSLASGCHG
jgi:hypothetical protein